MDIDIRDHTTAAVVEGSSSLFSDESNDIENVYERTQIFEKTALLNPSTDDYEVLVDRLRLRLKEGQGECIYEVGIAEHTDDAGLSAEDLDLSTKTLIRMCDDLASDASLLRQRPVGVSGELAADYLLRTRMDVKDFMEVRVAVVGNVDAGKSTLLGVLTHGELDNGRGTARLKLFRHKHEIESGRTSSVGNDILGFDSHGEVTNCPDPHGGHLDWVRICESSSKVITFIDLAGHEKYLKTTVFGMTGHLPDYCMLMVGSNAGIIGMTKEHLGLALALNVPVFVVLTKIDMCPPNVLSETVRLLQKILKSPGCRKLPVMVSNLDDVVVSATNFTSERICPIFQVSNVTGHNLDLLRLFLNLLPVRCDAQENEPAEFQIDDTYSVPGVGTVVSGTCLKGLIKLGDTMMLGPDSIGQYVSIPIKSIHRKRMPVREVRGGQTASFSLKKIKRSSIRKGMVLASPALNPTACWEFEGEILVLHHPTTISPKYQAMVHCGSIRQTATILTMSLECLRTGDKAIVHFRFIKNPEYLKPGQRLVFREGRTKAVGTITKCCPFVPILSQQQKAKARKQAQHSQQGDAASRQGGATTASSEVGDSRSSQASRRNRGGKRHRDFYAEDLTSLLEDVPGASSPALLANVVNGDAPAAGGCQPLPESKKSLRDDHSSVTSKISSIPLRGTLPGSTPVKTAKPGLPGVD